MQDVSNKARFLAAIAALLAPSLLSACGGSDHVAGDPAPDAGPVVRMDSGMVLPGIDGAVPAGDAGMTAPDARRQRPDSGPARSVRCGDPRPADAEPAPVLPAYSGGTCPALVAGTNTLTSGGAERSLIVVTPSGFTPGSEALPVVVLWHWLGGDADSFLADGWLQAAADTHRFIALIPSSKHDLAMEFFGYEFDPQWPYLTGTEEARLEEEAVFFDDMVTCAEAAFGIDEDCISTAGVSAGGLWVAQLLQRRGETLASAMIFSGGIGPASDLLPAVDALGWTMSSGHAMPVMVIYGGAEDHCGLDFQAATQNLETALESDGFHFVEECVHNCGHAAPPIDPTVGLGVLLRFATDHPHWLRDGESPYQADGFPEGTPEWCGMGPWSATARTGSCEGGGMSCPI